MKNEDRRVKNTQEKIKKSFWELLQQKSFESITVSKIADTANINRSTFYAHFDDKYDLLATIVIELLDFNLLPLDEFPVNIVIYFNKLHRNKRYLLVLFQDQSLAFFKDDVKNAWRRHFPAEIQGRNLYKICIMSAILMESVEWWLFHEGEVTSEEMGRRVERLINEALNLGFNEIEED